MIDIIMLDNRYNSVNKICCLKFLFEWQLYFLRPYDHAIRISANASALKIILGNFSDVTSPLPLPLPRYAPRILSVLFQIKSCSNDENNSFNTLPLYFVTQTWCERPLAALVTNDIFWILGPLISELYINFVQHWTLGSGRGKGKVKRGRERKKERHSREKD